MTGGRCRYCGNPTAVLDGPMNNEPRRATQKGRVLRIGYVQEAADGKVLDLPLIVCRECIDRHLPANVTAA